MINRKLDKLGRVVLPQEMRNKLKISHNTLLDIDLKGDKIIISKSDKSCVICGETTELLDGVQVCYRCATDIANKLK